MKGWAYVISNKRIPGIVEVGYSGKDPQIYADELNSMEAAPAYVVEYEMLVEGAFEIGQKSHKQLSVNHVGNGWYHCSTEHAVFTIKQAAGESFIYERGRTFPAEKTKLQAETPLWHQQDDHKYGISEAFVCRDVFDNIEVIRAEHAVFVKKYRSHEIAVDVDEYRAGFMYEKPGLLPQEFRSKQALMRKSAVGCFLLGTAMLFFVPWMIALGVFLVALFMVPQTQKNAAKWVLQAALQDPRVYQIAVENQVLVARELA